MAPHPSIASAKTVVPRVKPCRSIILVHKQQENTPSPNCGSSRYQKVNTRHKIPKQTLFNSKCHDIYFPIARGRQKLGPMLHEDEANTSCQSGEIWPHA